MKEEDVQKTHYNYGENDSIKPFVPSAVLLAFLVSLLPEVPVDFAGDEDVEDDNQSEEPPVVPKPNHPRKIKQSPENELCPSVRGEFLQAHFILQN